MSRTVALGSGRRQQRLPITAVLAVVAATAAAVMVGAAPAHAVPTHPRLSTSSVETAAAVSTSDAAVIISVYNALAVLPDAPLINIDQIDRNLADDTMGN